MFDYNLYLSAKDRRHLNIIEYLVFEENYISVYEIERLNNCSNRTVYNDIDELFLRFGDKLNAQFEKNVLKIQNVSSGNYEEILKIILENSTDIKVLKTLFEKPKITVEALATKNDISESYAYRVIGRLKKALKPANIKIKNRELELVAQSEQDLRLFLTDVYFKSSIFRKVYPNISERNLILAYIGKEYTKNHILNNDHLKFYLMLYLEISLKRENEGYHIDYQDKSQTYQQIPFYFKNKYTNINLTQFNQIINTLNPVHHCAEEIKENKKSLKMKFENELRKEHFKMELIDVEQTLESLIYLICFTQTDNIEGLKVLGRAHTYVKKLERIKPYYYNKLYRVISATFSDYSSLEDWDSILHILISVFMIENPTHVSTLKKSVLVTSDFSKVHAESIKVFMEYYFEDHFYKSLPIKKIRNADEALKKKIDREFDYVITTVHLENIANSKQIIVDDIFNEHDLMKFYVKLYN